MIDLVKTIYNLFMKEKENISKLEQQINEKPIESVSVTPMIAPSSDAESTPNQTVDILQELLNTIKQNNQLEVGH